MPLHRLFLSSSAIVLGLALPAQSIVVGPPLANVPSPVGDVDGDGTDDYATFANGVAQVHGSTLGAPLPHLTVTASGIGYVGVGDVDADGFADVAVATAGTHEVRSGASGAVLHSWASSSLGSNYQRVVLGADFDGDGRSDPVLIANALLDVRSGAGGTVLHSESILTGFSPPTEISTGDWNGDGVPDLALLTELFGQLKIVYGHSFTSTTLTGGGPFTPIAPRPLGDVDANGTADTASRTAVPGATVILDGSGGPVVATLPNATLRHFGDIDGDGRDDYRLETPTFDPAIDGLYSGATSTRLPHSILPTIYNLGTPGLGDLDGDGRIDGYTVQSGQARLAQWVDPALPAASRIVRRGRSGLTSSGRRPSLHARGHCSLGSSLFLDARGVQPNGLTALVLGAAVDVDLTPLGAFGNRLYADLADVSVMTTAATGVAHRAFVMPVTPALLGAAVSAQAAAFDPAANALGFVTSNAVDLQTND